MHQRRAAVEPQTSLAVLGSPVSHSRSPKIHRAAYEVLGLPWSYEAIECVEPQLAGLLAGRENWRGFSVTMPLKEEAHRLSAVLDPVAVESGVVNTLLRLAGDAGWAGFNTDVPGLAAAIDELGLDATNTLVIGAGATAVSAVLAARRLGARKATVLARRLEAAEALAARFSGTAEPGGAPILVVAGSLSEASAAERLRRRESYRDTTLIVSTLPGKGVDWTRLDAPLGIAPTFDVAYHPWPSPLAAATEAAGGEIHQGMGMLLHQALFQLRIFIGGDPALPIEREAEVFAAMRRSVEE